MPKTIMSWSVQRNYDERQLHKNIAELERRECKKILNTLIPTIVLLSLENNISRKIHGYLLSLPKFMSTFEEIPKGVRKRLIFFQI
jgi:hypothetical protein